MIKELIKVSCSFKNTSAHQRQVVLHLESIKFLTCCEQLVTKTEKAGLFMRVPQPYSALISLSLLFDLSQESHYHRLISTLTWNKSECLIIAVPLSFCHKDECSILNSHKIFLKENTHK